MSGGTKLAVLDVGSLLTAAGADDRLLKSNSNPNKRGNYISSEWKANGIGQTHFLEGPLWRPPRNINIGEYAAEHDYRFASTLKSKSTFVWLRVDDVQY